MFKPYQGLPYHSPELPNNLPRLPTTSQGPPNTPKNPPREPKGPLNITETSAVVTFERYLRSDALSEIPRAPNVLPRIPQTPPETCPRTAQDPQELQARSSC